MKHQIFMVLVLAAYSFEVSFLVILLARKIDRKLRSKGVLGKLRIGEIEESLLFPTDNEMDWDPSAHLGRTTSPYYQTPVKANPTSFQRDMRSNKAPAIAQTRKKPSMLQDYSKSKNGVFVSLRDIVMGLLKAILLPTPDRRKLRRKRFHIIG